MKRVFLFITLFMLSTAVMFGGGIKQKTAYYDLIESANVLESNGKPKLKQIDINKATLEKLSNVGVSMKLAKSIMDYKEKTGGFRDLKELKRIKGIGEVTYNKLKDKFIIKTPAKRKSLYINEASDDDLKLFGFDRNQIKKIKAYRDKNGRIRSNLDLMKILSKGSYDRYKDIIKYDKF